MSPDRWILSSVQPQYLYSHSRTCTHSRLCRRPSKVVAFYAISLIMTVFMRFQLSWLDSIICQTFPVIMGILIHCISSAIIEIMILCISSSWRFWSIYIVCGDDHTCHILYHAYSWPLYSYVSGTAISTCSYVQSFIIVLYWLDGWFFHWVLHQSTSGMDL